MTPLEKIKLKLTAIEEDPTPRQIVAIVQDIVEALDKKETIGFKDEEKK